MQKYLLIGLFTSLLANFFLFTCHDQQKDELTEQAKIYIEKLQTIQTKKNELNQTVVLQKAVISEHTKTLDSLLRENTLLKSRINSQIKINQKLEILNKELTTEGQVLVRDTIYYPVGTRFDCKEECFSLQSRITNTGLLVESFSSETEAIISLDAKNNVSLVLTNPCLRVSNVASIVQKPPKKWYENKWFIFSLGFVAGFGVTSTAVYLLH